MEQDRIKWNKKYSGDQYHHRISEAVQKFYTLAPKGRALDVAAGIGQNSVFLAEKGFEVDTVDISDVGLAGLAKKSDRVNPICTDLDLFDISERRYALIINIRFLNRRLFPQIIEGLVPGGILIFETYLDCFDETRGGSMRKDYLLRPNELLHAFLKLNIIHYDESQDDEKDQHGLIATLVARNE